MSAPAAHNLLLILTTFAFAALLLGSAYVGFLYGRESGACSARCESATNGLGQDRYYGGRCVCLNNGKDVSL